MFFLNDIYLSFFVAVTRIGNNDEEFRNKYFYKGTVYLQEMLYWPSSIHYFSAR